MKSEGTVYGFRRPGPSLKDGKWNQETKGPLVPHTGKFVTTASIYLSVTLNVPELPKEGVQLRAENSASSPGGGYIVAAGVRAQGVPAWIASPLGTGPNSSAVRRSLVAEDIGVYPSSIVGDIGVGVTMVEGDGRTATVLAAGVETEHSDSLMDGVDLVPGDLVHVGGADLAEGGGAQVLARWGAKLEPSVTLVLATSPAVGLVGADVWIPLLERADIVTMNIREAGALQTVLDRAGVNRSIREVLRPDAALVRRTGPMGCEVQPFLGAPKIQLPAVATTPVDTSGVGDTHVAVMCASLLQGEDLIESCKRANAGAAIEISHPTSFPLPTKQQVDRVLELGRVPEDLRAPMG